MIGPGNGVAAMISTPALDRDLTLSSGQLTSDAHNPASAATTANRACSQHTASRSITPISPRKMQRFTDDNLWNRASPAMLRVAKRMPIIHAG